MDEADTILAFPLGLDVDSGGTVAVANEGNHRFLLWDRRAGRLRSFGDNLSDSSRLGGDVGRRFPLRAMSSGQLRDLVAGPGQTWFACDAADQFEKITPEEVELLAAAEEVNPIFPQ